jgi:hypothetical protein
LLLDRFAALQQEGQVGRIKPFRLVKPLPDLVTGFHAGSSNGGAGKVWKRCRIAPRSRPEGLGPIEGTRRRMSCDDGAHGPRVYDWAWLPIRRPLPPGRRGWVLARRSISDPTEIAYYVCFGRRGTRLRALVRVAGSRWAVEGMATRGTESPTWATIGRRDDAVEDRPCRRGGDLLTDDRASAPGSGPGRPG